MDGQGLINKVLQLHELQDPADGENTLLRLLILQAAQETVDEVHLHADFPYKHASVTKTFAPSPATAITLDADFAAVGPRGAAYAVVNAIKYPLTWKPQPEMTLLQAGAEIQDKPIWYSEGPTTTAGLATLLLYPFVNANCSILVDNYDTVPPTITDASGTASGLPKVPVQYHLSVIYAGTVMRRMDDKGDLRGAPGGSQDKKFRAGLKAMVRNEIGGKSAPKRMPPYRGARGHYR